MSAPSAPLAQLTAHGLEVSGEARAFAQELLGLLERRPQRPEPLLQFVGLRDGAGVDLLQPGQRPAQLFRHLAGLGTPLAAEGGNMMNEQRPQQQDGQVQDEEQHSHRRSGRGTRRSSWWRILFREAGEARSFTGARHTEFGPAEFPAAGAP